MTSAPPPATGSNTYVIPPTLERLKSNRALLIFPIVMGSFAAAGFALGSDGHRWDVFFTGLAAGFFCAIPVVVIWSLVRGFIGLSAAKKVWATHNFAWYRETFPSNARPNGHVTCRHCGSHKTHVRNLMNHTFMRVHSCGQCGETLYFSPEKI